MARRKISIVIPIFNEVKGVVELVQKTAQLPLDTEIIIVDDGSGSETKQLLATIKEQFPTLVLLTNKTNIGKTASIQKSLQGAKGRLFVILDGDSELNPDDILIMCEHLVTSDARFINGSRITSKKTSFISKVAKKTISFLLHAIYGRRINDPLSGLKLFYTDDFINYQFSSKKFGLETELIIEAVKRNYNIEEVEVRYYPRTYKEGKKIRITDGVDMLKIIWQKSYLPIVSLACIIWLIVFSIYMLPSNASPTTDTIPNTFTAVNIVHNKRLDLTNFRQYLEKKQITSYVATVNTSGTLYAKTPIIMGLLTAPFIFIADQINGIHQANVNTFIQHDYESYYQLMGRYYGALLASLSVVFMFLILNSLFHRLTVSFLGAMTYALGTAVYSTAAQGNWQHAPSLLLITIAHYCLLKRRSSLASVLLAIATLIRISNGIFFVSIVMYYALNSKRIQRLIFYFIVPIIIWNIFLYLMHIPGGYNSEILLSIKTFNLAKMTKVMISLLMGPNVGLLIFSPIAIFGLLGILKFLVDFVRQSKKKEIISQRSSMRMFLLLSVFSFIGIFLFNSIWWAWEGGYSWGPRLLTEGWPFLIFLGTYYYISIQNDVVKKISTIIFFVLLLYSFFVQMLGVYAFETSWQSRYFKGNGSFVTAWYNNPNIIDFYIQRRLIHTAQMIKKNKQIYIETNLYRADLNFDKPLSLIQNVREKIK